MSKSGLKIVTIGGGSSYTPELVEGFIKRYDHLPITELWLVDVEAGKEKLEIVGNLAKRMVEKAGLPIEVHLTLDRRTALKDADFVTTQLRVGLLDARVLDETIPAKYGILGQETNGPGGLFKGFRTIPVILGIIKDMEELCPDAWLINFTNPAGMVTEAVFRHTTWKKFVGLCNVPIGMVRGAADLLEVDMSRVRIDFAGLNHMVYGLRTYLDGKDVSKLVMEKYKGTRSSMKNIHETPWGNEFLEGLGIMPCGYHRYYYQYQAMVDHQQEDVKKGESRGQVVKKVEAELFELYKDVNLAVKPKQLELRGGAYYSDAACNLIASMYNDTKDIQPVNTMNMGAIASLPMDCAVEVSCVITKEGPRPLAMGRLPIQVEGLVQQMKSFEQVATDAAVSGNYNTALVAMTINPLVRDENKAKLILDEMLEAHKAYLPQFFK
ncbi:MAG TPA: 6-phospho-beta-glucosidase [Erysipelotrichaceae bacterium]|nr:6-phospho-beta-glucosidase [Erysipelotrichaceae bacterium]